LTLGLEVELAVGLTLVLLFVGAWRFSESVTHGPLSPAGTLVALLVYGGASEWARRTTSNATRVALEAGARVGLLIGALAVVNHSLEVFSSVRPPVPAILGVSMWGVMFFCFGGVASATSERVGSIGLGVVASMWTALVSSAATVLFASVVGLVFMPRMQLVLAGDFATSGMVDARAHVVRHLFDGAATHLLLAPFLAAMVGAAGGLVLLILRPLARRTVVALGSFGVLLLLSGVAAIRVASALNRSARPPFIMFGLVALCVSLASAYPIMATIRRPNPRLQPTAPQ
jgi:hypothetical protein